MRRVAIMAVLAGCGPGLKHHSSHNAPGNVDIDAPPARQTAEPDTYEVPVDPGENALGIAPGGSIQFGAGRLTGDTMAMEFALQLHLSYSKRGSSRGRGAVGYGWDNWGATVGWAFVQNTEDEDPETYSGSDTYMGPIYAEVTRQWYALAASAGVAIYPTPGSSANGRAEGVDAGAQISLMCEPFGVRARFVQDSGFEIFAGYQFEIPYAVTWSQ
jgi:hypothetical protein